MYYISGVVVCLYLHADRSELLTILLSKSLLAYREHDSLAWPCMLHDLMVLSLKWFWLRVLDRQAVCWQQGRMLSVAGDVRFL